MVLVVAFRGSSELAWCARGMTTPATAAATASMGDFRPNRATGPVRPRQQDINGYYPLNAATTGSTPLACDISALMVTTAGLSNAEMQGPRVRACRQLRDVLVARWPAVY